MPNISSIELIGHPQRGAPTPENVKFMTDRTVYQEPLVSRYTSREMQELFSEQFKFTHWRRCWVALAEAQHELGLKLVTREMVEELRAHVEDIDYEVAAQKAARLAMTLTRAFLIKASPFF